MNGCHGNQSCDVIFIKTSYSNQYIVFNKPMKNSSLSQRVHVSEIYVIFSQSYPTCSRSFYDPTAMILATLYKNVPYMLPAKYQPNRPGGSREEVV